MSCADGNSRTDAGSRLESPASTTAIGVERKHSSGLRRNEQPPADDRGLGSRYCNGAQIKGPLQLSRGTSAAESPAEAASSYREFVTLVLQPFHCPRFALGRNAETLLQVGVIAVAGPEVPLVG
jgi:hypothetical protein